MGKFSKAIWFTFKPIPIIEALIVFCFMTFSIKIPHTFLSADKMSLGHFTLNRGIESASKVLKSDKAATMLI